MILTQQQIDDILFMFDEERQPISQIAYMLNFPISTIDEVICSRIANNILEIV